MKELNVFVSVGATATAKQEQFVRAVEDRLRSEGLIPHTVGRNTFSADAPLRTSTDLMNRCAGVVVIALERFYFPSGVEKRDGPQAIAMEEVRLPTPWNQIEAAMAYSRELPLLVIAEVDLKSGGLLERGHDWYVQFVRPEPASLATNEFNGVLASWKEKVIAKPTPAADRPTSELTIAELTRGLTPAQLWAILGVLTALVTGSFSLGVWSTRVVPSRTIGEEPPAGAAGIKGDLPNAGTGSAPGGEAPLPPPQASDPFEVLGHDFTVSTYSARVVALAGQLGLRSLSELESGKRLRAMPSGTFGFVSSTELMLLGHDDPSRLLDVSVTRFAYTDSSGNESFEVGSRAGSLTILLGFAPEASAQDLLQAATGTITLSSRPRAQFSTLVAVPLSRIKKLELRMVDSGPAQHHWVVDVTI